MDEIRQFIEDMGFECVTIFENPDYSGAFLGVEMGSDRAVYDYDLMVDHLMDNDEMTREEAMEFIDYNSSYGFEGSPMIITRMERMEYVYLLIGTSQSGKQRVRAYSKKGLAETILEDLKSDRDFKWVLKVQKVES